MDAARSDAKFNVICNFRQVTFTTWENYHRVVNVSASRRASESGVSIGLGFRRALATLGPGGGVDPE